MKLAGAAEMAKGDKQFDAIRKPSLLRSVGKFRSGVKGQHLDIRKPSALLRHRKGKIF
jgi:hypothetical protein